MIKKNRKPFEAWGMSPGERPLLIAGPCSAESKEQLEQTMLVLKKEKVDLMRAGIWKPRTRPNCFEGLGEQGLVWLSELRAMHGVKVCTEVSTTKHLELFLKYDLDVIWIGARTTANPFMMQALADALRGVDKPVLIKNPINPDLELWIGAIERIQRAGVTRVGAVHRGFSTYNEKIYRNNPLWTIPLSLRERMPEMPLLCDPSHIAGKRALLEALIQQALELEYDGLMIEVHPNPTKALSDSEQQLNLVEFSQLLERFQI